MKKIMITLVLLFVAAAAGLNIGCRKLISAQNNRRNVAVNRINAELTAGIADGGNDAESIISANIVKWKAKFGDDAPESISFIPVKSDSRDVFYAPIYKSKALCAIYDSSGEIAGFAEYRYSETDIAHVLLIGNIVILVSFLIILAHALYIWFAVIVPFRRLSDYPERLARLRDIQKLPESRSRYFGRYIWGMNMLSDVLASSTKRINELEGQRRTLVSSIAHGVKTPVSNIRLYTDAVRTGLYSSDHDMIVSIADKIDKNTEKIDALAAELLNSASSSASVTDLEISRFSVAELAELVKSEYKDRMAMKRIPFEVECNSRSVMESDKYALFRTISQILENAVKYGDGHGIRVSFTKQDESFCISVKNSGELLPEKELPYIFRSYWRGSNAAEKDGSGIGMYVVNETVKALGGKVYVRRHEDTSEMEFVIYIENP
ncbi:MULTISPECIES: sensor histidine kinase [Ruminococcus]|uniref:histidine kinase n=1 Tax=Ruminococcus flavefaciens TaxID=1265 RepID=A0A1M7MQ86_RUMFL|nr:MULTISPECIES: HAMP domain-containing sensor histidine kinase [Ruminococcus]MCR4796491.1 HAMP domain-containing histidine kinase [Ruminococcus sp.]SHM93113.1 Signal transduction histidine kinase [Ruminococcus flavefaciens]